MTLKEISSSFQSLGCQKLILKFLAPNDDNRHGILLGGHNAIHFLPSVSTKSRPIKSKKPKKSDFIFHHQLDFTWLHEDEHHHAPAAKLIYYPQYPEVRLSGFLKNCKANFHGILSNNTNASCSPRVLILGRSQKNKSFGMILPLKQSLKKEILGNSNLSNDDSCEKNIFEIFFKQSSKNNRTQLLKDLKVISEKNWLNSCKLNSNGLKSNYNASNGGGFTLEAHLGILPNSSSSPDYLGWEVKQSSINQNILSLFTPEPDGGLYYRNFEKFMSQFGYRDPKDSTRINFGGTYKINKDYHEKTKLKLILMGFNNGQITNPQGMIALVNSRKSIAASWSFEKLLESWIKKHSKAVFIKSERKLNSKGKNQYRFLSPVYLAQGTSFEKFLTAIDKGWIYLDPAHKMQINNGKAFGKKKRSQFRISKKNLHNLYSNFEMIQL